MIQLHTDCLVFETSDGDSIPCSAQDVTVELLGDAGPIELYDMSNDGGEKNNYAERRPDLARHAANLMTKMHAPDPNWKVRGRR